MTLEQHVIDSLLKDIRLIKGYAGAGLIANELGKQEKLRQIVNVCVNSIDKFNHVNIITES